MTPIERNAWVKRLAADVGLDRCGVSRAAPVARGDYVRQWLEAGRAGSMHYLHRFLRQRLDPCTFLEGAASVVMVALNHHQPPLKPPPSRAEDCSVARSPDPHAPLSGQSPPRSEREQGVPGRIAMYAWGEDYHDVMKRKLALIAESLREEGLADGRPAAVKICVDTAPLLEREFAAAAGLGWIGKNTLVLAPGLGSMFFLGAVVTSLEIAADPLIPDHCGTCRRCLDACPTQAFPAPYQMDASRCISYLTIEHRGAIPDELRSGIGEWLFGCDICQEVCPFNRDAPPTREPAFAPRSHAPTLDAQRVLEWTPPQYQEALRGTAVRRAKLDMLQRNASIVLANQASAAQQADSAAAAASPGCASDR
ncbi:MAG: tRNA epoxyqueuosine(34) reductase QueG [Phycisphaerales bacterium]|nr:tRNA epoxyqueuosine(34) reductase QueG [Phycisphaerales bacterium]